MGVIPPMGSMGAADSQTWNTIGGKLVKQYESIVKDQAKRNLRAAMVHTQSVPGQQLPPGNTVAQQANTAPGPAPAPTLPPLPPPQAPS